MADSSDTTVDRHFKPADTGEYLEGNVIQHPDWRVIRRPDGSVRHVRPGDPGYEDAEPYTITENLFRTIPEQ